MKLKLDENLDARLVPLLAAEGFDADSVRDEGLSGSQDEAVYDVCKSSERVLITLDLAFSIRWGSLRPRPVASWWSARHALSSP